MNQSAIINAIQTTRGMVQSVKRIQEHRIVKIFQKMRSGTRLIILFKHGVEQHGYQQQKELTMKPQVKRNADLSVMKHISGMSLSV